MSRFRYSFMQLIWWDEPIGKSVERLARYGYDAIELLGDLEHYDVPALKKACADHGLVVSSVGSLPITPDRDLVHPDAHYRRRALSFYKETLEWVADLGADVMITSPSILMKTSPMAPPEQEWEWAIEGIRSVGEHAATMGIDIVLEAWNRYETYFNKTLADAVRIWEATGLTNGGAMGDLFHMNMEEKSLSGAIRETGPHLRHMHLCDSTRAAPGEGEIDFQAIMDALVDIDYQGWLSMELIPSSGNPLDVIKAGVGPEWYDQYAKQSIDLFKSLEP